MPKRDPVLIAFGQCVRKHRDAKGFSQETLAEKADLDRTYIIRVHLWLNFLRIRRFLDACFPDGAALSKTRKAAFYEFIGFQSHTT